MKLSIPKAAFAQHGIALGKTGSGKSSKLRVIVEQMLDSGDPVCIVDPKGDWWGLKSSADGKSAGYAIVIFGGEHADVPINAHSGTVVAEIVATGNRPCIVDLGGWRVGDRTKFFIDFAETLFKMSRGSRHLVIDEVHNFAPQGKIQDPAAGLMLHWANRLASEGRGKGIAILAASQRPQKVHKDFLTSCETLIAGRVIHKLDRDAIKDWIDGCADSSLGKQVLGELAMMKRTEAWVWSPEIEFGPERITFPMFATYDSFKPQAAAAGKLKGWADVDLEELKSKLSTVIAEAESNDPKKLKARIAELERRGEVSAVDFRDMFTRSQVNRLIGEAISKYHLESKDAWDRLNKLREVAEVAKNKLAEAIFAVDSSPPPAADIPREIKAAPIERTNPAPAVQKSSTGLSPTARKIIDVIHRSHPVALSFDAAAARACVSKRSSAYRSYRKEVAESSEVIMRDDGRFTSAPGYCAPAGPGINPIEEYANKLPASYARMLRTIAAGGHLTKGEIALKADISPTSSGLSAGLKELIALSLVERFDNLYSIHSDLKGAY